MGDVINIDSRPDVAVRMPAKVRADESGEPRIIPFERGRWRAVLSRLVDKTITVQIIRTKKRSPAQNRYLWGIVYDDVIQGLAVIAENAGEPAVFDNDDELHEAMKWRFLRRQKVMPGGELIEVPGSSANLTMEQFSEYVSQIMAWASHYGIRVRSAGEDYEVLRETA